MNKMVYGLMSVIAAFALTVGNHYSVHASSASVAQMQRSQVSLAAMGDVTQSYIVDKDNVGGNRCNDTWPGTLNQPFCTINKGIAALQPGEALYVRGGTYPAFSVNKSNITISGYSGEFPIINGGIGIRLYNASYVTLHGFEVVGTIGNWSGGITLDGGGHNIIDGNKAHDNTNVGMSGIQIYNSSFNKVANNEVYNNYESGITISGNSSDNDVGFNKSHDNTLNGGDSDGISLSYPSTRTNLHDNLVYGNSDDGIDTWDSTGNFIIGNIVHDQNGIGDGNGIKLGDGATGGNNLIKQNISYNNKVAGFTSNRSGGNTYYNNVAYNNNYGFDDGLTQPSMAQNTYINNIGYNNVIANFSASIYPTVSHNNIWYSDGSGPKVMYEYSAYATLSAFFLATGLDNPDGDLASLQVAPQFVNPAGGLFDLSPSSPAIDRGDPTNPGQVTAFNRVDIGAIEYAYTSEIYTVNKSLTSTSTGASDGWALESTETSGKGGSINTTATTLRLGDNKTKKQYRGILSFSTADLPDNATITKITLKVKKQSIVGGGNPVTIFKGFMADIKKGTFGTSALQTADFQTGASKSYGPFKTALSGGWYSIDLTSGHDYINKLSTSSGLTQIRLRFYLDDNNNATANYLSLYSGNITNAAYRPQLVIEYYVP